MSNILVLAACLLLTAGHLDAKALVKKRNVAPITCEAGFTKCPNKSECVRSNLFCDGDDDCGSKSDEPNNCSENVCLPHDFRCDGGQCLNQTIYCLDISSYGCRDSTDMSSICTNFHCPNGYSKCGSTGKCVQNSKLCNGFYDCADGSDESREHCVIPVECPTGQIRCPASRRCINSEYMCDTDNDCRDNSDEDPSFCSSRTCQPNEFQCNNGQCVDKATICAGFYTCRDGSFQISNDYCGSYEWNPPSFQDEFSPECVAGLLRVLRKCGNILTIARTLGVHSEKEMLNKLLHANLREVCSPVTEWFQCVKNAMSACTGIDHPEINDIKRTINNVTEAALNYICEEKFDVINRHKACLLRYDLNAQVKGEIRVPKLARALYFGCLPLVGQLSQRAPCLPREAQTCAKNLIAAQCGEEIAGVSDKFADRIRTALGCPT